VFEHRKMGKLHLLQLRCYGPANRVSATEQEPGVNPRTKKSEGRIFRYNDLIFSVSAFGYFLSCFHLSDSCPQKARTTSVHLNYPKQALAAVTDR